MSSSLEECRDFRLTVRKDGRLQYTYGDETFRASFTLLSEVGEPWKPVFVELLRQMEQHGCRIEYGRHLEESPWVADFVVKESKHV